MAPVGKRAAALALGVLVLSGCSGQEPIGSSGLAADSDSFTVTQTLVADEVALVQGALGQPAAQPETGLASAVAQRLVRDRLVAEEARLVGVSITQTEVEKGVADLAAQRGGLEALNQAALQAGVPVESLEAVVRSNLLVAAIGEDLAPTGDAQAQSAAVRQALTDLSQSSEVQVSPRYGVWNHDSLAIVGDQSVVKTAPLPEPSTS